MKEYRLNLEGDGDFRSPECESLTKISDIVVTNPPFSLFREYVDMMFGLGRRFLIIGSMNAITYKDIFPLIKDNRLWLGINNVSRFIQPDGSVKKFGNILWYTNLDHVRRHTPIPLTKKYDPEKYPRYDNYDAIEVSKVSDIPCDYIGDIGVPCTFITKYDPDQFEVVRFRKGSDGKDLRLTGGGETYGRYIIRRKTPARSQSDSERPTWGGGRSEFPFPFSPDTVHHSLRSSGSCPGDTEKVCSTEKVAQGSSSTEKSSMQGLLYGGWGSAAMAVPITFLQKFNPEQFEILDANDHITNPETPIKPHGLIKDKEGTVGGGNPKFARILVRRLG